MSLSKSVLEAGMEYGAPVEGSEPDESYVTNPDNYPESWKPFIKTPATNGNGNGPRITNVHNLPEPLVKAVTRHPHERVEGRISVTELIQPPQLRKLSIDHKDEIIEDAGDRIWSLLGTLLHGVLERNARDMENAVVEEALETEVLGWTVVGHYDLSEMILEGEWLTDWKLTSVWAMVDGVKPEWEQQLNCYAELIRRAGRKVDKIQIVAIGRDWSKSKARYDANYPQEQVKVMQVKLWTPEQASAFLEERVRLHQEAEKGHYADCTPDERWARQDQWAVMKKGQKRAVRLYDTAQSAIRHVGKDPLLSVVPRPGESVRCGAYCPVSQFCKQYARMKADVPTRAATGLRPE